MPPLTTPSRAARLALCAVLSFAGGCGVSPEEWAFNRDLVAADALVDDGEYAGARERYLDLAWRATRPDVLRYIQFRVALTHELAGETDAALEQYDRIASTPRSRFDHDAGRAMLHAAELRRTDDIVQWRALLEGVITTFPDTLAADDALTALRRSYDDVSDGMGQVDHLARLFVSLRDSEIGDNLAYWVARVVDERLADCPEAIELYAVVIQNYHRSALVDDSTWRTALCLRDLGRIDAEYAILADFFAAREVSFVMADYESDYYRPALRRMAEIHEERQQWAEAVGIWELYLDKYPLTLRFDDTLYHIMELHQRAGDRDAMEHVQRRLERDWPDSRFTARGRALLDDNAATAGSGEAP